MNPLTQEQVAAIVGVTTRAMQKMDKQEAGPPRTPSGRYACEEFGHWLHARHRAEFGVADDGEAYDFQAERARLTKAQADKAEMELAEMRGELVRSDAVSKAWIALIAAARARLILLPPTIAPRVASGPRIAEVQEVVQEIVYEALNELAGDGLPPGDRAHREDDEDGMEGAAEPHRKPVGRSKAAAVKRVVA